MIRKLTTFVFLFMICCHPSFATGWAWAKNAVSGCNAYSNASVTDASGNIYVTGFFRSATVTFGSVVLTNSGSGADLFLVKYNSSGSVVWARRAGGSTDDESNAVAVDAAGNVYITGYSLSPSLTFGSTTLTASSGTMAFLAKYDPSGNVLWATNTDADCGANDVAVDPSGNVYITGYMRDSTMAVGGTTLVNGGVRPQPDMFLIKYSSSGSVLWAKNAGGIYEEMPSAMATDAAGDVYVTGYFQSPSLPFGSTTLTNATAPHYDIFIVKYNASGSVDWANSAGGSSEDYANAMTVDNSGNIYVAGRYNSASMSFGATTLSNTSSPFSDVYLTKYSPGGSVLWAQSVGGSSYDYVRGLATDASGNVYMAGSFTSSGITLGGSTYVNAGSYNDIFLAKYDPAGTITWSTTFGGTSDDYAGDISIDPAGNLYLFGAYSSPSIAVGSTTMANAGIYDVFLAKYGDSVMRGDTPALTPVLNAVHATLYPNPVTSELTIDGATAGTTYRLVTVTGQCVLQGTLNQSRNVLNVALFPSRLYMLELTTESGARDVVKVLKE